MYVQCTFHDTWNEPRIKLGHLRYTAYDCILLIRAEPIERKMQFFTTYYSTQFKFKYAYRLLFFLQMFVWHFFLIRIDMNEIFRILAVVYQFFNGKLQYFSLFNMNSFMNHMLTSFYGLFTYTIQESFFSSNEWHISPNIQRIDFSISFFFKSVVIMKRYLFTEEWFF